MSHPLEPLADISFFCRIFKQLSLSLSHVSAEKALVDVFALVDLESLAFTHLVLPVALVYRDDLILGHGLFIWPKWLLQVDSHSESFFLASVRVDLAYVHASAEVVGKGPAVLLYLLLFKGRQVKFHGAFLETLFDALLKTLLQHAFGGLCRHDATNQSTFSTPETSHVASRLVDTPEDVVGFALAPAPNSSLSVRVVNNDGILEGPRLLHQGRLGCVQAKGWLL